MKKWKSRNRIYKNKPLQAGIIGIAIIILLIGCASTQSISNKPVSSSETQVQREPEPTGIPESPSVKGNFDKDQTTDYASVKEKSGGATITIHLGNGELLTKTINSVENSWINIDTVVVGDFNMDGLDEIVFNPMIYGSNYGSRSLYIFQVDEGDIVSMPLTCIENNTIEFEQPKSLNEDDLCIGTEIIVNEDQQLLRVRRLIQAQENSAWNIDVSWNGKDWQIENVSIGSAYGD